MIKQLTQELIDLATAQGVIDYIAWENGLSSIEQVDYIISTGISVPQAIIDFLTDDAVPGIPSADATDYPPPIFRELSYSRIPSGIEDAEIVITGDYFNPGTIVTCDTLTVNSTRYINSHELIISINTVGATGGFCDLKIEGNTVASIEVFASQWIDFRLGGDAVDMSKLEVLGNITPVRTDKGIGVESSPAVWGNAIGFPEFSLSKYTTTGCQIILQKQYTGRIMLGMWADNHGVDTTLYNETIVGGYLSSRFTFWGYYAFRNLKGLLYVDDYSRIKLVFPSTVSNGAIIDGDGKTVPLGTFKVYGLQDDDDFDDGILLHEGNVLESDSNDSDTMYPVLLPHTTDAVSIVAFNRFGI